ncbi:MAG: VWA domain-containing protein [Chitinophagales bacterium]
MNKLFITAFFISVFCCFQSIAQPKSVSLSFQQTPLINVLVEVNNCFYQPDSKEKFVYLYINAKAAKFSTNTQKPPLNLSLVLDRSGSMSGAKLKYARQASKVVIDHLDESDILSIIAYDHEIEVMQPSLSITNSKTRKQLKRKIDAIYDNGATNLGGGMLEGFKQVSEYYNSNYVNRVLLLSDGLANRGIIDPKVLKDTTQYFHERQNMSLSTFGLGADFDEDLMEGLAEYGGANYYFIDKAEKVTETLLDELRILQNVVSQKELLKVVFPSDILQLEEAYGLPINEKQGVITVSFSNMFAGEEKAVLLKFLVLKTFQNPIDIATTFSYATILKQDLDKDMVQLQKTLHITPTHDVNQWEANQNKMVYQQIALYKGNATFRKAIEAVDASKINVAKNLLKENLAYLQKQIFDFESDTALNQLQSYNQTYLSELDKFEDYSDYEQKILQKSAKNMYYRLLKKKKIDWL